MKNQIENKLTDNKHSLLSRFKFFKTSGIIFMGMLFFTIIIADPIKKTKTEKSMRIGVIGAGWLGGTVGKLLVLAGHEVMFSSRHPENHLAMAKELGSRASIGTPRQAAEFGTIILFAVPYDALPKLGSELKDALKGKIVLDACNPQSGSDLAKEAESIGVGQTSVKYLPGVRLVRAFSAVDATAIESSAGRDKDKLGVPLASDDTEAIQVAAQLVRDVGSEPVIVGNLSTGKSFQRGGAGFRANTTAPKLRKTLSLPEEK